MAIILTSRILKYRSSLVFSYIIMSKNSKTSKDQYYVIDSGTFFSISILSEVTLFCKISKSTLFLQKLALQINQVTIDLAYEMLE